MVRCSNNRTIVVVRLHNGNEFFWTLSKITLGDQCAYAVQNSI